VVGELGVARGDVARDALAEAEVGRPIEATVFGVSSTPSIIRDFSVMVMGQD
jgi:hypothetical protein